jgi:isocitrate dehydrogenase (NAD+)
MPSTRIRSSHSRFPPTVPENASHGGPSNTCEIMDEDPFYAVTNIEHAQMPVDSLSFQLALDPQPFDVLLLQNLYGDILSDLAAGLVGGLGVVPGANIGDQIAVFEAVHGTAPDIAGKGIANPLAVLMSGLLMLEYVGEQKIAQRIEKAVFDVLEEGKHLTGDLGGNADTARFTEAIIDKL